LVLEGVRKRIGGVGASFGIGRRISRKFNRVLRGDGNTK